MLEVIGAVKSRTSSTQYRSNLDWLADNFKFTLLLDEVSRKIEPAYKLKDLYFEGELTGNELARQALASLQALTSAPIEELFRTFARRVRSRGELGELSSMNQKLWLQYQELERFLSTLQNEGMRD